MAFSVFEMLLKKKTKKTPIKKIELSNNYDTIHDNNKSSGSEYSNAMR